MIGGGSRDIADSDNEPGEFVDFDGSASFDPDGQISGCEWTVNGEIQDVGCTSPLQFRLDDGDNTVTLVVSDDGEPTAQSAPTTVTIHVAAPGNQPPVAVIAGGNRSVGDTDGIAGETVSVDGSGSSDADGSVASYQWTVNARSSGPRPAQRPRCGSTTASTPSASGSPTTPAIEAVR